MKLALYAHPWDLRALAAQAGLERLRALGYSEIALAVSYHAGRWLTPWDPTGMVRFLEDGVVHFRPRGDYGVLEPLASSEVVEGEPSPLEWLCAHAPGAGIDPRAWMVGTHNTRLGELHPDQCVENAFGDLYFYSLCPRRSEVRQYLQAMIADVAAHQGLARIEIEGFSWMGWKHSCHHEKSSVIPSARLQELLGLCFCSACLADPLGDGVRDKVADYLRAALTEGDAMEPVDADAAPRQVDLEPIVEQALVTARAQRVAVDCETVAAVASESAVPLALQVHQDPHFRGSQMAFDEQLVGAVAEGTEGVMTTYGTGPDAIEAMLAATPAALLEQSDKRLCIWPKAPQFTCDADLQRVVALCRDHGFATIAVYHLGMLPWRTIERVAAAMSG